MIDAINQAIDNIGGKWIKLRYKADPQVDGTVLSAEERGKTFEGKPVLSRATEKQRVEWVFTLQTDARDDADDDGVRKFAANESAQRAIAQAVKESGRKLETGGRLRVGVVTDPVSSTDQSEFKAKYEPPAASAVTADDIFG